MRIFSVFQDMEHFRCFCREIVDASPQEIAYLLKRMETDDHFLVDHCTKTENAEFTFIWSPEELFGMEME